MRMSEQCGELAKALAAAQSKMAPPVKDKTAKIQGKDGKPGREYHYADISTVIDATREELAKNGLAISQTTRSVYNGGLFLGTELVTILLHSSGQFLESDYFIPRTDSAQQFGGQLTYHRRYQLCSVLGIAAESDDDAQEEQQPKGQQWQGQGSQPAQQQQQARPVGNPNNNVQRISEKQAQRMWAIARQHSWDYNVHVKAYIKAAWGVESHQDLNWDQYDLLCGNDKKGIKGIIQSCTFPQAMMEFRASNSMPEDEDLGMDKFGGIA